MTDKLITPAVAMAVSIAAARTAARANGTALDSAIEAKVRGITADAELITRRAFITQARRVTLDSFDGPIYLDYSPVVSVVVKYIDPDGDEQTLAGAAYYANLVSEPSYLVPAPGAAWPATLERANVVTVDYVCGYGVNETAVPPAAKEYILAKVEEAFAHSGLKPSDDVLRSLDGLKVYG